MDGQADQFAALPWRGTGDRREYLLVTSRRTGRWIFPKGSPLVGEAPAAAALREAAEEAGVDGGRRRARSAATARSRPPPNGRGC